MIIVSQKMEQTKPNESNRPDLGWLAWERERGIAEAGIFVGSDYPARQPVLSQMEGGIQSFPYHPLGSSARSSSSASRAAATSRCSCATSASTPLNATSFRSFRAKATHSLAL